MCLVPTMQPAVYAKSRSPVQSVKANTKPEFTRKLVDTVALMDEDCRLRVKVSGHPPPTVTWLKDGEEIITLTTLPNEVRSD